MAIRKLISTKEETETFRFGNGGTQQSRQRWKLPIMVGKTLVCVWVSVVQVPSLGLLLGRDFLDSIGGVLSFARKLLRADHLDGSVIRLQQLLAGHFALQLLPKAWPLPGPQGWKTLGVDGVLELQISSAEWLSRRLQATGAFASQSSHEHLITEHAVLAADVVHSGLHLDKLPRDGLPAQEMLAVLQPNPNSTTTSSTSGKGSSRSRRSHVERMPQHPQGLGKNGNKGSDKKPLARARHIVMALAAISAALSALSVPGSEQCGPVAAAGRADGQERSPFPNFSRGPNGGRDASCSWDKRGISAVETTSSSRSSSRGQASRGEWSKGANGPSTSRTQRRSPNTAGRFDQACSTASHPGGCKNHCRPAEGENQTNGEHPQRSKSKLQERAVIGRPFLRAAEENCGVASTRSTKLGIGHGEADDGTTGCQVQGHLGSSTSPGDGGSADWRKRRGINDRCQLGVHRGNYEVKGTFGNSHLHPSDGGRWTQSKQLGPSRVGNGCGRDETNQCRREKSLVRRSHDGDPWAQRGGVGLRLQREKLKEVSMTEETAFTVKTRNFQNYRKSGSGRHVALSNAEEAPRDGVVDQKAWAEEDSDDFGNPWKLNTPIKKGQALMISQAWDQHVADRQKVSATSHQVLEVYHEDWLATMQESMNEVMMASVEFPSPLVSEVYTNSQNILREAKKRGHGVGSAMSLETGWNFLSKLDREAAKKKLEKEQPYFLVLAFPCGARSQLLNLNPPKDLEGKQREAKILLMFALELALMQKKAGRHFVLENPLTSKAWGLKELEAALKVLNAGVVDFDQCSFNLRSADGWLHKKATRMASSSDALLAKLSNHRCTRDHEHQHVIGGNRITSAAGIYPHDLAKAMVDAMEEQFVNEHRTLQETFVVDGEEEVDDERPVEDAQSDSGEDPISSASSSLKVSPAIRMSIKRLHEATGHRRHRRLARALIIAGAPTEAVLAAKQHKCALCDEKRAPKSRRPASLPNPRDVSDQVHIDVFDVFDSGGKKFQVIHVIDWATRFQMAQVLENRTTKAVVDFLDRHWLPVFGPPRVLVADQAREFVSWEFESWAARHSVLRHPESVSSHLGEIPLRGRF